MYEFLLYNYNCYVQLLINHVIFKQNMFLFSGITDTKKCAALRQRILIGLFNSDVESGAECLVNGGTDGANLLCVANNVDAGLGADMAHCVGLFRA